MTEGMRPIMLTQTSFPSRSQCKNLQNIVDTPKYDVYNTTSKNYRMMKLCYDILLFKNLLSRIFSTYPTGNPCALEYHVCWHTLYIFCSLLVSTAIG